MEVGKVSTMKRGWFIGNFEPSMYRTEAVEVAVKSYTAGDYEEEHYHKVATEFTVILSGEMKMNGEVFVEGDIVKVFPGEKVKFECIKSGQTVVVKLPGVINDKYM